MKKNFLFVMLSFAISCSLIACGCTDKSVPRNDGTPSNLVVTATVNSTNNGSVDFIAKADNANSYEFDFGNGMHENSTTGNVTYVYPATGNYTVTVKAKNASGNSVSKSIQVSVTRTLALVWFDEFNGNGAPDPSKWNYDIGTGEWGWGNNELQYYTNRLENAYVSDGTLKIIGKKESYSGSNYTSARLKTLGKFDFTYGKVDIRLKLPTGVKGIWPAAWMLGSNIATVPWPGCGEIDIMEYLTRDPENLYATFHYPARYGDNADGSKLKFSNPTTDFHVFTLDWSAESLKISVDGQLIHSLANKASLPFNNKFFILLNMALGGNFGGALDPAFTNATYEIDYVRVYQ